MKKTFNDRKTKFLILHFFAWIKGLPSTPNTNSTTSIPPPYGLSTNPRPRRSEDSIQFIDDSRHGSIDDLPGDRSRTLERKKMKRVVDNFDDTFWCQSTSEARMCSYQVQYDINSSYLMFLDVISSSSLL